jgi:hypothetical protein
LSGKSYTRDLTEAAREGKLDPVIGRDEQIGRTIQVLSRRTQIVPGVPTATGRMSSSRTCHSPSRTLPTVPGCASRLLRRPSSA